MVTPSTLMMYIYAEDDAENVEGVDEQGVVDALSGEFLHKGHVPLSLSHSSTQLA